MPGGSYNTSTSVPKYSGCNTILDGEAVDGDVRCELRQVLLETRFQWKRKNVLHSAGYVDS